MAYKLPPTMKGYTCPVEGSGNTVGTNQEFNSTIFGVCRYEKCNITSYNLSHQNLLLDRTRLPIVKLQI